MKIGIKTIAKGGRDENSTLNTTETKGNLWKNTQTSKVGWKRNLIKYQEVWLDLTDWLIDGILHTLTEFFAKTGFRRRGKKT